MSTSDEWLSSSEGEERDSKEEDQKNVRIIFKNKSNELLKSGDLQELHEINVLEGTNDITKHISTHDANQREVDDSKSYLPISPQNNVTFKSQNTPPSSLTFPINRPQAKISESDEESERGSLELEHCKESVPSHSGCKRGADKKAFSIMSSSFSSDDVFEDSCELTPTNDPECFIQNAPNTCDNISEEDCEAQDHTTTQTNSKEGSEQRNSTRSLSSSSSSSSPSSSSSSLTIEREGINDEANNKVINRTHQNSFQPRNDSSKNSKSSSQTTDDIQRIVSNDENLKNQFSTSDDSMNYTDSAHNSASKKQDADKRCAKLRDSSADNGKQQFQTDNHIKKTSSPSSSSSSSSPSSSSSQSPEREFSQENEFPITNQKVFSKDDSSEQETNNSLLEADKDTNAEDATSEKVAVETSRISLDSSSHHESSVASENTTDLTDASEPTDPPSHSTPCHHSPSPLVQRDTDGETEFSQSDVSFPAEKTSQIAEESVNIVQTRSQSSSSSSSSSSLSSSSTKPPTLSKDCDKISAETKTKTPSPQPSRLTFRTAYKPPVETKQDATIQNKNDGNKQKQKGGSTACGVKEKIDDVSEITSLHKGNEGISTKSLLFDYLQSSESFGKSMDSKSLKTYIPSSLTKPFTTTSTSNNPLSTNSNGFSSKHTASSVTETPKYVKFKDKLAQKLAEQNEEEKTSDKTDKSGLGFF